MSDRDAEFTAFVEGAQGRLRRVAYLLTGDWHRADDVLQDALVKLYAAWPRVHRDGREEAYARRIVVRTDLDARRRPHRRERLGLDGVDVAARPGLAIEERSAMWLALRELPPMQRKTVVLRHWLGLSVEETAAELGVGTGTVKSHTARAVARLQEALTPTPE